MRTLPITKQPFYKGLYVQVLVAIAIGTALGHWHPETAVAMKPFGDGLVKPIKMAIAPIIFRTVVIGIADMQSMKLVGKTGGMALLYFEITSTVALITGLVVVDVVQPDAGMHVDPNTLDTSKIAAYAAAGEKQSTVDFLMNVIPGIVVDALANGGILQVPFFSVPFGYILYRLGSYGKPVFEFVERVSHVMFNIIDVIMKVAPTGTFGAMAFTTGAYGVSSLVQLGQLMLYFYITCVLFVLIVLGGIARAHGFSILRFIRYIREELLIVLGTLSSESALPRIIDKMEKLGCNKSMVGLVIPTGYSFNLDGTSIYLTMAVMFIAQVINTPMDITHQVTLLLALLIAPKGAAGVIDSSLVVLAATLSAVGHLPVAGLALILGIDRFMSEARAPTNLAGNGMATVVVSKWCKQFDEGTLQREPAGEGNASSPASDTPVGGRRVV